MRRSRWWTSMFNWQQQNREKKLFENRAVRKRRASKHQQLVHTGNVVEEKGEEFLSSYQLQGMQQKNSVVEATTADMNHIFDGIDTFGLETKGSVTKEEKDEQPTVQKSEKETQEKNIERKSTMQILFPASNEEKGEQPQVEKSEKETQEKKHEH